MFITWPSSNRTYFESLVYPFVEKMKNIALLFEELKRHHMNKNNLVIHLTTPLFKVTYAFSNSSLCADDIDFFYCLNIYKLILGLTQCSAINYSFNCNAVMRGSKLSLFLWNSHRCGYGTVITALLLIYQEEHGSSTESQTKAVFSSRVCNIHSEIVVF